jgi:D-alanyl-lipoteichoic acid acyltransferase DltB (MBOAT superfamily)
MIRFASALLGGKGSFEEEWNVIAPTFGSLVFACGIAFIVVFIIILPLLFSFSSITAFMSNLVFFIIGTFALLGFFSLFASVFILTVFGWWLEELQKIEGADAYKTGKILGIACGITCLVVLVALGIYVASQYMPSSLLPSRTTLMLVF